MFTQTHDAAESGRGSKGQIRLFVSVLIAVCAQFGAWALTPQNMADIQQGMRSIPLFKDLPLSGDPGDISNHWEMLQQLSSMSAWNIVGRNAKAQKLNASVFGDLKRMNQLLANEKSMEEFKDPDVRRSFAARYCHLLYFILRYYSVMGWNLDVVTADFATSGWPDAADYRWQANAAKMREWLGAPPLSSNGESAPPNQIQNAQGTRSARDVEAAIRNQERYIRDLERKLDRANDDYSSYQDAERRRRSTGGRSHGSILNGKLRTIHNFERLIRENERVLQQLQAELDVARARESAATESKAVANSPEKASPTSSAAPVGAKGKKFCTECGEKVEPNAKFCGACGHKL